MNLEIFRGILIPFLGTTLGGGVRLFYETLALQRIQRALTGFAAGIMTAASVWSLLIPAMEQRLNGKAGVSAGGGGLSGGYLFPAGAGPSHPAPAHEQQ